MAVPTFLVGVLPGYQTLGLAAPILLTLLRMIQGLSVGGEYTTSIVFMVEQAGPGRRGVVGRHRLRRGRRHPAGLGDGRRLSAAVLSPDALETWGWRIPFVLGLFVGLAGFFLRRGVEETPRAPASTSRVRRLPIRCAITGRCWRLAGFSVFNSVGFYLMFVYIVSWLQFADGIAPAHALEINTLSMVLLLPLMLAVGWLSDRVGRKALLLAATALAFVAALPLFWLMHHRQPDAGRAGPARLRAVGRHVPRHPARLHGRGDAACRALHGDRARLQHDLRRRRRTQPAGRDLAGRIARPTI